MKQKMPITGDCASSFTPITT